MRDPNQLDPKCRGYVLAPGGHPEGWLDSLKNSLLAYYRAVLDAKNASNKKPDYATFHDGYDISCIVDAIVESQQKGKWVKVAR
jgi:predicted dehydrogenase